MAKLRSAEQIQGLTKRQIQYRLNKKGMGGLLRVRNQTHKNISHKVVVSQLCDQYLALEARKEDIFILRPNDRSNIIYDAVFKAGILKGLLEICAHMKEVVFWSDTNLRFLKGRIARRFGKVTINLNQRKFAYRRRALSVLSSIEENRFYGATFRGKSRQKCIGSLATVGFRMGTDMFFANADCSIVVESHHHGMLWIYTTSKACYSIMLKIVKRIMANYQHA